MNEWLKSQLKTALLRREIVCEKVGKPCRFAIVGYCLQELKGCEYFLPAERRRDESNKGGNK